MSSVWNKLKFQAETEEKKKEGQRGVERKGREGGRRRRRNDLGSSSEMGHLKANIRRKLSGHTSLRWPCLEVQRVDEPCVIRLSSHVSLLPNLPSFKDLYLLPAHLSLLQAETRLVTSLLFSLRKISHAIDSEM